MLAERLRRPNNGCEHNVTVGGAFQKGNSDIKDKPYSRWPCTDVTLQNEECLNQLIMKFAPGCIINTTPSYTLIFICSICSKT